MSTSTNNVTTMQAHRWAKEARTYSMGEATCGGCDQNRQVIARPGKTARCLECVVMGR
jgi:hypothetical protein